MTVVVQTFRFAVASQRPQEVEQVLLLSLAQHVEVGDGAIRLREHASVRPDGRDQIGRPAVVQEEQPLTESPERRGPELSRSGLTLAYTVGQSDAHVVDDQIRKEVDRLVAERRDRRVAGSK